MVLSIFAWFFYFFSLIFSGVVPSLQERLSKYSNIPGKQVNKSFFQFAKWFEWIKWMTLFCWAFWLGVTVNIYSHKSNSSELIYGKYLLPSHTLGSLISVPAYFFFKKFPNPLPPALIRIPPPSSLSFLLCESNS